MTGTRPCSEENGAVSNASSETYANLDGPWGFAMPSGTLEQANYMQQYSQLYFCRLAEMRNFYSTYTDITRVAISQLNPVQTQWVVGIIFKQMPLKPSILKSYADDIMLTVPELRLLNYTSGDDRVYVEDETGRIECVFHPEDRKHDVVTGMVIALQGLVGADGLFCVNEIRLPMHPAPIPLPCSGQSAKQYICFLSGVDVRTPAAQLFLDYVTGCLGADTVQLGACMRVIVAGNLRGERSLLDLFLKTLAEHVPVDLMPGEEDPVHAAFPQQPWHRLLLPQSASQDDAQNRLVRCSNPHAFQINGCLFLGTSGQNVKNFCRFSRVRNELEALQRLLECGHLAPTCPDTMACVPRGDHDPLVIREVPHVLFTGNADTFRYQQRVFGAARNAGTAAPVTLLTVPRFDATGTAVLLALPELTPTTLQF
jgi:DNA polymerase delta subunit 2